MGIPVHLVGEDIDWPAIVQAACAVIAVFAGFGTIWVQRWAQQREAKKAASIVALNAIDRVTDRFEATLIHATAGTKLALRGDQSREWVAVLSEIDVATLPPKGIVPIAKARAALFAINGRIDEIYRTEAEQNRLKSERLGRLRSAAIVLAETRREFAQAYPDLKLQPVPQTIASVLLASGQAAPFL